MIEITAIDHIVLRTNHLDLMIHFYCDILGCKIERELPEKFGLTQLRAGNALIDLVSVDSQLGKVGGGPPTATENHVDHFCLQIRPLSEHDITRHLSSFGIASGEFAERYGAQGFGNSIYIKDPDGNTVELRAEKGNS